MARRKPLDFGGVAEPRHIGQAARGILHKTVDDGVADLEMAKAIRLDLIDPDPEQPRKHFDAASLEDLARSILLQGVLQPIVVEWVPARERFRIVSGERRWRATRLAAEIRAREATEAPGAPGERAPARDLGRIPAIVSNPTAIDRYVQQLYENEQRQDYSDVERAFAYERLKESLGLTWEELASRLGLSKGRVHQIRRTKNRLAPAVQRDITSGALTGRHGLYLAPLPESLQEAVAGAVKERRLTHQQTQTVVQRVRARIETTAAHPAAPPADRAVTGSAAVPSDVSAPDATAAALGRTATAPDATTTGPGRTAVPIDSTEPRPPPGRAAPPVGEGALTAAAPRIAPGSFDIAALVDEALVDAADGGPAPSARRPTSRQALELIRRLVALELVPPRRRADRAALAAAVDELAVWTATQRGKLGAGRV